ncbi:MAG TPA: Fis family transcriptional regulator, partial [Planctomycetaceae bacterium]|nr:Fis family transcriptional regulator [Planctomycetaceae bacterium]
LELVEPELIRAALKHCKGNRSAAAQRLGIHRETLREKMGRYGIKVE